jgi:uncharacterized membrane protein
MDVPLRQIMISLRRGTAAAAPRTVLVRPLAPGLALVVIAAAAACGGSAASPSFAGAKLDASAPTATDLSFSQCGTSPATGTIPASVSTVLHDKCQACHGTTPMNGAPISLVTYADVHIDFGPVPTYQVMDILIQPGSDPHMPFESAPPLTAAEFTTLESWLGDCAPSGN